MAGDRMARLAALFDEAVALAPAAQAAFVAQHATEDPQLGAELARLLDQDRELAGAKTLSALDWTQAQVEAIAGTGLEPGALLGPWRIVGEIGRGGMGRVFRASRADGAYTRDVAIKVLRRELVDPALLRRFSLERDVLAALDHPNIARMLDAATTADGAPFVAMELVEGVGLLEWCDERALVAAARVRLFRQVVDAVAHAHRQLVVHRDIKPSNVLVTHEGVPKLLDFGIAKPLGAVGGTETATSERYFTPWSAAPEQLRGEPVGVGCDVYALGLLLYQLLAGRAPFDFDGLTPGQVEQLVCHVPPPAMASVVADRDADGARRHGTRDALAWRKQLRGDLEAIVQRALRKEPRTRYATVEQLDADLDAWLDGRPVVARGGHAAYRLRRFVARHRALVTLGSAAAIALLATGVTISVQNRALERERDRVTLERDRAEQVVDLLRQSFEAADPGRTGGKVDASAILKAAQERLPTLASQPELHGELAELLVRVQLGIGLVREAADAAEQAVVVAETAEPSTRARLQLLHARALAGVGDYARAEATLPGPGSGIDMESAEFLSVRALIHGNRNRVDAALADLLAAMPKVASSPPTDSVARGVRWRLIDMLEIARRYDEALVACEQMLEWQKADPRSLGADLARTEIRHANLLFRLTRYADAAAIGEANLAAVEAVYGDDSVMTAAARMSLANSYGHIDRLADAEVAYRAAVDSYSRASGPDHPDTLMARFNLALLLARLPPERHAEADRVFVALLTSAAANLDRTDTALSSYHMEYAHWLADHDRPTDALAVIVSHPAAPEFDGVQPRQVEGFRTLAKVLLAKLECVDRPNNGRDAQLLCSRAEALVALPR